MRNRKIGYALCALFIFAALPGQVSAFVTEGLDELGDMDWGAYTKEIPDAVAAGGGVVQAAMAAEGEAEIVARAAANVAGAAAAGSTGGGIIAGRDCYGMGLARNSTMAGFATGNSDMLRYIISELLVWQSRQFAVKDAIDVAFTSISGQISASRKDINLAFGEQMGNVIKEVIAKDHDPADKHDDCEGLKAGAAAIAGEKQRAAYQKGFHKTGVRLGDNTTANWAQAKGQKVRTMLESAPMKDQKYMKPEWLLPEALVVAKADYERSLILIDALANSKPAPAVPEDMKRTPAGKAAALEIMQKTAYVDISRSALDHVLSMYVANPQYKDIVPKIESDNGLSGNLVHTAQESPSGGAGYSPMQFLDAMRIDLGGLFREQKAEAGNEGELLRQLADLMKYQYLLSVYRYKNRLYQTELVAAMTGLATDEQGQIVADRMADNRQ